MAALLRALQEPRRQAILRVVWDGEVPAGEIHRSLGQITFGAVSQHLRILRDAGLVDVRSDGRRRLYRARKEPLGPLADWLESMWRDSLGRLQDLAEGERPSVSKAAPNSVKTTRRSKTP